MLINIYAINLIVNCNDDAKSHRNTPKNIILP